MHAERVLKADTGLPDFFRSLWPKWLFFEKVMAKITTFITVVIFIFIGVSNSSEGSIFFAKEASFYPKTAISAVNLKLPATTCLYLS